MNSNPVLSVIFFQTDVGNAPVQQWLKSLAKIDRKTVGGDIQLVQFCWPIGLPLVRKLDNQLWEVRSHLSGGRIARVLFTIGDREMVLLHGYIKKSQNIPKNDLKLARRRRNLWQSRRKLHEQI